MLTIQPRDLIHGFAGADAVGLGDGEGHAQRQSQQISEQGGDQHHHQRIPGAGQQDAAVFRTRIQK